MGDLGDNNIGGVVHIAILKIWGEWKKLWSWKPSLQFGGASLGGVVYTR